MNNIILNIVNIDFPVFYTFRSIYMLFGLLYYTIFESGTSGNGALIITLGLGVFALITSFYFIIVGIFSKQTHIRIQQETMRYSQNMSGSHLGINQKSITFDFTGFYNRIKLFSAINLLIPVPLAAYMAHMHAKDQSSFWFDPNIQILMFFIGGGAFIFFQRRIVFGGKKRFDQISSISKSLDKASDLYVFSSALAMLIGVAEVFGRIVGQIPPMP